MKEGQAKWFISLFGTEKEMEQLRGFLDLPNCRLVQATINKGCYLTSCRFSNLTDSKKVCESAKKLLTMIKAFAKIECIGDFYSITIGRGKAVVYTENATTIIRSTDGNVDGKADVSVSGITARASASANVPNVVIQDENGNIVRQERLERLERWFDYYLNRCDDEINHDVIDALSYYAEDTSWYSLWKVFETITLDINSDSEAKAKRQIDKYGWIDEDKLNAFGYWAQYDDAVCKHTGCGSRHSLALHRTEKYDPKQKFKRKLKRAKKQPVMGLQEAEQLIASLLKKWIESKRPETMMFHCFNYFASLIP